jgi:hypothetical protein
MIKAVLFSLVLLFAVTNLFAQSISKDSAVRIAHADVRHFRLSKMDMKQFRKEKKIFNTALFTPTKAMVSDTALLSNPDYVSAFSVGAYKKTKKRRTVWHYAWIVGTGYVAVSTIALFVLFASELN